MIRMDTSDLEEIKELPEFRSELDDFTLAAFKTDADRVLAKSISALRSEAKYASELSRQAYNRSVQNARFIRVYGPFIALAAVLAGIVSTAFVSGLINK